MDQNLAQLLKHILNLHQKGDPPKSFKNILSDFESQIKAKSPDELTHMLGEIQNCSVNINSAANMVANKINESRI